MHSALSFRMVLHFAGHCLAPASFLPRLLKVLRERARQPFPVICHHGVEAQFVPSNRVICQEHRSVWALCGQR